MEIWLNWWRNLRRTWTWAVITPALHWYGGAECYSQLHRPRSLLQWQHWPSTRSSQRDPHFQQTTRRSRETKWQLRLRTSKAIFQIPPLILKVIDWHSKARSCFWDGPIMTILISSFVQRLAIFRNFLFSRGFVIYSSVTRWRRLSRISPRKLSSFVKRLNNKRITLLYLKFQDRAWTKH